MKYRKAKSSCGIRNLLALRPPAALLASHSSTTRAIGSLRVDVYRVDASPPRMHSLSMTKNSSERKRVYAHTS